MPLTSSPEGGIARLPQNHVPGVVKHPGDISSTMRIIQMKKKYEGAGYAGSIGCTDNHQESTQQQNKINTIKTPEDEIFLNQLKAMDEAGEKMVIFLEDIRAVGLEVFPREIIRVYEGFIEYAEGSPEVSHRELREEMKANLRSHPTEKGTALVLNVNYACMSFHGNPYPLETLRNLFRKPERIVIQKKGGA